MNDLEQFADRLRLVMVRLRIEREPTLGRHWEPLPWEQLAESERNQWRDTARACLEVVADGPA